MSITSATPSASTVVTATKSITTDVRCESEEKDVEQETAVIKQVKIDENDADYDPKQESGQDEDEQGITDEEEDLQESADTSCTEQSGDDEEKVINSEEFATEFNYAIYHVLKVAKMDRERIIRNAKDKYQSETGEEATDAEIANAFRVFNIVKPEIESEDECIVDVDPAELREAFEEALVNVRAVAKLDQETLYERVCNTHYELCGTEPDSKQISEIFGRIKEEFAEEAREEFLELNEVENDDDSDYDEEEEDESQDEDDSGDEDYSPSSDDFDYTQDVEEDKFASEGETDDDEVEEGEENESENQNKD